LRCRRQCHGHHPDRPGLEQDSASGGHRRAGRRDVVDEHHQSGTSADQLQSGPHQPFFAGPAGLAVVTARSAQQPLGRHPDQAGSRRGEFASLVETATSDPTRRGRAPGDDLGISRHERSEPAGEPHRQAALSPVLERRDDLSGDGVENVHRPIGCTGLDRCRLQGRLTTAADPCPIGATDGAAVLEEHRRTVGPGCDTPSGSARRSTGDRIRPRRMRNTQYR